MTTKAKATKASTKTDGTKKSVVKASTTKAAPAKEKGTKAKPIATQPAAEGTKVAREIAALAKLTKVDLQKRYEAVFGYTTNSHNSNHLRNVIARRLAEQAAGKGKGKAKPREVASGESAERDPRMPKVGTVLEREHNGKVHKVKVLESGFEYHGQKYRSLSGLAKEITGAIWNGWVWFGLVKRPEAKKGSNHAA
jgi:hypothetical protein